MKFHRKERTVNPADPTQLVTYEKLIGPVEIIFDQFFGDITGRIYFRSKQLFFTSPCIHRRINAIFEWLYNKYESKRESQFVEEQVDFSWHCGSLNLKQA